MRSETARRATRATATRPAGQPQPAGTPASKESTVNPKPPASRAEVITPLESAERSVSDAMSLARAYECMVMNQGGEITMTADGLFLVFEGMREKCDQASRALAELRSIVTAGNTNY
jgi:hypothetical protein